MWLLRALKVAALLTPFVPAVVGYRLCTLIGLIYFVANRTSRRSVLDNLKIVNPQQTRILRWFAAVRVCITVVTNYYDLLRLRSVDRESILDHVEIDGFEHLEHAIAGGNGAIVFSAHVGNFSVVARLPAALGFRSALIAEEVRPQALFAYMSRLRSAMGIEVICPGTSAVSRIVRLLRANGLLLVAGDREVSGNGMEVEFFGRKAPLPYGPVYLAMRTGAPLIPAYTFRESVVRSRVVISPPMRLTITGNWDADLRTNVQALAGELEKMIQTDPGQWAVLQRVWPPTTYFGRSEGLGGLDKYLPAASSDQTNESVANHRRTG